MRKLSELMNEPRETLSSRLALVLFDNVLDPEKVLQSPEIGKLAGYFFANTTLSLAQVEDPEKLHDWLREEQYKTDVQGRAMIYPVKARFEDWTLDTHSDEFSGPLYVQVLSTDEAALNILTITCQWYNGLFRNDYYVVGAIVSADDLERIIKTRI
jgi:hypothetical protein